jgi:hypothetical protein
MQVRDTDNLIGCGWIRSPKTVFSSVSNISCVCGLKHCRSKIPISSYQVRGHRLFHNVHIQSTIIIKITINASDLELKVLI